MSCLEPEPEPCFFPAPAPAKKCQRAGSGSTTLSVTPVLSLLCLSTVWSLYTALFVLFSSPDSHTVVANVADPDSFFMDRDPG